jgi:membrane-bound lytic murein transglycosylase D
MHLDGLYRFSQGKQNFLFIFLSTLFLAVGPMWAQTTFPVPQQLQDNVEFWTKIYAQYSDDEVVIHDAEHLKIIYETINLGDYFDENISYRIQWRKVEKAKDDYIAILNKLARMSQPIDSTMLNEKERNVYNLWANVTDTDKFSRAVTNIRGQKGLRDRFKLGLERSGRYMDEILDVFRRYDLPQELCYLPHVESSFNYKAYSKMGAAGIWQFTRSTGRLFMKVDYAIDERLDPSIATEAAARLLKKNYNELGSWPLAITAYNHGLDGMKRAKSQVGTDDFGAIFERYRSRSFGFASRNFYAEFLAAKEIAQNYEKYYGSVNFEEPVRYHLFEIPDYITMDALAQKFRIEKATLVQLNPALRNPVVESKRRIPQGYKLKLPYIPDFDPNVLYAQVPKAEKHEDQVLDRYYKVQAGDNLGSISRQVGAQVDELMALNDISDPRRLREGQLLELPTSGRQSTESALLAENTIPKTKIPETEILGGGLETVASPAPALAPALAPSQESPATSLPVKITGNLISDNAIANNPEIPSGLEESLVTIPYGPEPPPYFYERLAAALATPNNGWAFQVDFEEPQGDWIVVQPDETLGHYADWAQVPTQRLRMINNLPYSQEIQVGRRLQLVFANATPAEFHRRRLEYHRAIQEDFFSNYKLDEIKKYAIQEGDNIWALCARNFEVPYWLLSRFNKNRDLMRLHPGDQIEVPVIAAMTKGAVDSHEE